MSLPRQRLISPEEFRSIVRDERKRQKLTQSHAAALIGTTQKWLSDFERGRTDPPLSLVLRIVNLLGIKLLAERPPDKDDSDNEYEEISMEGL